ncbi:MAG TPA: hypothetical protein ENH82_16500 [bacterium]|nr:hypothetical protein [bacterium]
MAPKIGDSGVCITISVLCVVDAGSVSLSHAVLSLAPKYGLVVRENYTGEESTTMDSVLPEVSDNLNSPKDITLANSFIIWENNYAAMWFFTIYLSLLILVIYML